MFTRFLLSAAISAIVSSTAVAAVSPEEAARLGNDLTRFGAIKAGNAEGSIPEYTGGGVTIPAEYKQGSGKYPNPFADEKPLLVITAANMSEHLERLDEGTQALLQRWPDTFKVHVYPTHRTASYPEWVLENTVNNATSARLVNEQGDGVEGAYGGIPFPIPQNGLEVLWNHLLSYRPLSYEADAPVYMVDRSGKTLYLSMMQTYYETHYYNPDKTELTGPYHKRISLATEPARVAGEGYLTHYEINYAKGSENTWAYSPGQRRVRLAPEFKYDTPSPSMGGALFFDEIELFTGQPDRFDWKLIGSKEMYIPYNAYDEANASPDELFGPQHPNPEKLRWELHRVWEIEATVRDGARHAFKKRKFYIDEDSWKLVLGTNYDHAGEIARVLTAACFPVYDPGYEFTTCPYTGYDFTKGQYIVMPMYGNRSAYVRGTALRPPSETTSSAMQGMGIR